MNKERPTEASGPKEIESLEELVDEWGDDSFPASDPPGGLPPTLAAKRLPSTFQRKASEPEAHDAAGRDS